MPEVDLHRYQLPDQEHERIFRDGIIPERLANGVRQCAPVVVSAGGQQERLVAADATEVESHGHFTRVLPSHQMRCIRL
jgi:predicted polyphosphate/ATP-dependent NAD kinase